MSKSKDKKQEEKKSESLREQLINPIQDKYGDIVLPTTITGKLETGWIALDYFAPIELGTSILIYGPSQSGKSLMMMKYGASVQNKGGLFVCFNTEAANRDVAHLKRVVPGLSYEDIVFYQPDTIEHTLECIHMLVDKIPKDSPVPMFISIDSINSCATKREMESEEFKGKDMSGAEIAAIWSKFLRQVSNKMSKKPVVLCLISQERIRGIGTFATSKGPSGGEAPYFYASTVLRTYGHNFLYQNEPGEGYTSKPKFSLQGKAAQECSIRLEKSRYSSGGGRLNYTIDFSTGIKLTSGLLDLLEYKGIVEKSGTWYSYKEEKLGQGKHNAEQFLLENESVLKEVKKELNKF